MSPAPPRPGAGSIVTEHRYDLPVDRGEVWALISDVDAYRSWCPWLRDFDGTGLAAGSEWRCQVQPPLPYSVRFRVLVEHVEAPVCVRAHVEGDVTGTATLTLFERADGCTVILASSLGPSSPLLRLVSRLAAPVARFGHDWVLESGARQFVARAVVSAPVG